MLNIILGGCGFIGTNLSRVLLSQNERVISIDNLSNGKIYDEFLVNKNYKFINLNLCEFDNIENLLKTIDSQEKGVRIWHLAANSDIAISGTNPFVDYKDTLGTTIFAITLAMQLQTQEFIFASSSAIYGNRFNAAMSENMEIIFPSSFYGIAKLASEMYIAKQFVSKRIKVRIYRFPNVIGLPMTHGVFRDFYSKLKTKPDFLEVLGNGKQTKPFLHIDDLISAMLLLNSTKDLFETFNIGPNDKGIEISDIAKLMVNEFSPSTKLIFGESEIGWDGDIPKYHFDLSKAFQHGLNRNLSSKDSVKRFISELKLG